MPLPFGQVFHLPRLLALATNTFTQLVRMRVFYFLLFFALLILGVGFFLQEFGTDPTRELRVLKDLAFFAMSIFSTIFAIAATANLLPKDLEDRTLYTILSKPVPRWEYLLGKYLGVLFVAGLSLLLMSALLYVVLNHREQVVLGQQLRGAAAEDIPAIKAMVARDGVSWGLLQGVVVIFLQAGVLAAVAILVSCFATSGLFTIIIVIFVYLIGFAQPVVVEYWRHGGQLSQGGAFLLRLFELTFPNFQSFNVIDGIVAGERLAPGLLGKIAAMAGGYVSVYLFMAYLLFAKKEL